MTACIRVLTFITFKCAKQAALHSICCHALESENDLRFSCETSIGAVKSYMKMMVFIAEKHENH